MGRNGKKTRKAMQLEFKRGGKKRKTKAKGNREAHEEK